MLNKYKHRTAILNKKWAELNSIKPSLIMFVLSHCFLKLNLHNVISYMTE